MTDHAAKDSGEMSAETCESFIVIDDAYDVPTAITVGELSIVSFWEAIEHDALALSEIDSLGLKIYGLDDVDNDALAVLWKERESWVHVRDACESLFSTQLEKHQSLEPLCEVLKGFSSEVYRIGTTSELPSSQSRIVFVDYYLGETGSGEAIVASTQRARDVYQHLTNEGCHPVVVLMSSANIDEEQKRSFRRDSGLIGGMFYFIRKDELIDTNLVRLKVASYIRTIPRSARVGDLINAMQGSISDVSQKFLDDIKSISVGDYVYIQRLKLAEEGQPLGEYMLWLFSEYFSDLVRNNRAVLDARDALDKLTFNATPPSVILPSPALAKIYQLTIFDLRDNVIVNHPLSELDASSPLENPVFHLGDTFINDASKSALLLINAECDLAFTPIGKRKMPKDRSIVFLTGKLCAMEDKFEPQDRDAPRTEPLILDNVAYRIVWSVERIRSIDYSSVVDELSRTGFKKVARMRMPYALELQQVFSASLTRVGMPVSPPFYQELNAKIEVRLPSGEFEVLGDTVFNGAVQVATKFNKFKWMLTVDLGVRLREAISQLHDRFNEAKESTEGGKERSQLGMVVASLIKAQSDFETAFLNGCEFDISGDSFIGRPLGQDLVQCGLSGNTKWKENRNCLIYIALERAN